MTYRETIPFQGGETIVLPAGIEVRSTNPSKHVRTTVRRQKVKLHSASNGSAVRICHLHRDRRHFPENAVAYARYDELEMDAKTNPDPAAAAALLKQACSMKVYTYSKPEVCWVGAGGYWCYAAISDVAAANGRES